LRQDVGEASREVGTLRNFQVAQARQRAQVRQTGLGDGDAVQVQGV
jgi:hypothetical protein